jgi:phage repressor protein C with HTH and peptisase S24 domain
MQMEIPLLRAAAGSPLIADAEMVEVERDYGVGRFLLELRGDSMEPRFMDKQRIVMRDKNTLKRPLLKYGELYAFVVDGRISFKQWAKGEDGKVLRSLNAAYPDIPLNEETDWIGWYDPKDNQ